MNPKNLYLLEKNINTYLIRVIKESLETLTHDPNAEKMFKLFYNGLAVSPENYTNYNNEISPSYYQRINQRIEHFHTVVRNAVKGVDKETIIEWLNLLLSNLLDINSRLHSLPQEVVKMIQEGLSSARKGIVPYWAYPSKLNSR